MATAASHTSDSSGTGAATRGTVIREGYLIKQGGAFKNWNKRHFVLTDTTLSYYKKKNDPYAKGEIDLKAGRGVRSRWTCYMEDWPQPGKLCFGVATESRVYYICGTDENDVRAWRKAIQAVINKVGKPDSDMNKDPKPMAESRASKVVKESAKMVAQMTKRAVRQAGLDQTATDMMEDAVDMAEDQAQTNLTMGDKIAGNTAEDVADAVSGDRTKDISRDVQRAM